MPFKKVPDPLDKIWEYKERSCRHPEHEPPPTMVVLEPGLYEWTCPACGAVRTVRVPARARWAGGRSLWQGCRHSAQSWAIDDCGVRCDDCKGYIETEPRQP